MKKTTFLIILGLCTLFQVAILDYFRIFGVKPDLFLISVFCFSLSFQLKWAVILSVCAGITKDIFAPNSFGVNTLLFALLSLLIIKLSKEISIDSSLVRFIILYIISFCNVVATRFIFFFLGNNVPINIFFRNAFLGSLYTALVAILFFGFVRLPQE